MSSSWSDAPESASATGVPSDKFSIHEQDRAVVRENLVRACVEATREPALQLQLCVCLLVISR